VISGRPTTPGTTAFTVRVRDSVGTISTRQLFIVVTQPPPPLVIQTVSLADTTAERTYSQTLQATGGVPPYSWSIASGNLGAGLNLSANGVISGTPMTPGTSVFVVRVTDSAQVSATRTLAIQVKPADKLAPFGGLETPGYNSTLNNIATGTGWALDNIAVATVEVLVDGQKVGEATYGQPRPDIATVWGNFPNSANSGFTFSLDTTKFSNGDHTLAVRALDAAGNATLIGTRRVTLQNRVFIITTTELTRGKKGEAYSLQLQAANGVQPYTWTLASGSLPAGLSLNASGRIAGTPTVFGNFPVTIRVTDANGTPAIAGYTLTILPDVEPLRVISSGEQFEGLTGVQYTNQLYYAGGRSPIQWSVATGALPPGLTLDAQSGIVSGRPRQAGTFNFTARVTDSNQQVANSGPLTITVRIGPLSVLTAGTQVAGRTGVDYSLLLGALGGASPYTWAVASGTLPPGLSVGTTTGLITGKPSQVGSFTFIVRVTDSVGTVAASDPIRIDVTAGPLIITSAGDLTAGKVNTAYTHQLAALGGRTPYAWAIATGALPAGLTLNPASGVISGTPTQAGIFNFTLTLTDGTPQSVSSGLLRIIVSP
jgi:hypothetical protein